LFLNKHRLLGLVLVGITVLLIASSPFQQFASIPHEIRVFEGKSSHVHFTLPAAAQVVSSNDSIVHIEQSALAEAVEGVELAGVRSGTAEVQLMLGKIPVKRVKVNVLPDLKVIPGGQSIGVKLNSLGVVVVGHHFIQTEEGKVSPGEEANVKVGDVILKMNDVQLKSLDQIGEIVEKAVKNGNEINLEVLRGKEKMNLKIHPVYDEKEKKHRLGLYIRNAAAGVGTLTFHHPESGAYGALGHVISDMDTQKPIIVGDGSIVNSSVSSIERGESGQPGEKSAIFINEKDVLGDIKRNTPFGIFGTMKKNVSNGILDEPIPIALNEEIKKGPAYILTVVEGQKVEKFDIEIVDVVPQKYPATKGLVLKVTDPELLEKTGGIVQGMSGSPIIQDGKLVGAVTHVFINDPTSGYGCFIEWMLQDAGIQVQPLQEEDAAA
jgi:stage IV sporulation protein B